MTRVLTLGKYSSIHLITFVRAHITSVLYNAEDKPGPSDEVGSGRKHPDPGSETDSLSGDAGGRIHARGSEQQGNAAEGGTGSTRQIDTRQSTISGRIATVVRMVTVTAARLMLVMRQPQQQELKGDGGNNTTITLLTAAVATAAKPQDPDSDNGDGDN